MWCVVAGVFDFISDDYREELSVRPWTHHIPAHQTAGWISAAASNEFPPLHSCLLLFWCWWGMTPSTLVMSGIPARSPSRPIKQSFFIQSFPGLFSCTAFSFFFPPALKYIVDKFIKSLHQLPLITRSSPAVIYSISALINKAVFITYNSSAINPPMKVIATVFTQAVELYCVSVI